jgi:hypothetical protein
MGILNTVFGGRGSNQGGAYAPPQITLPSTPVTLPPFYGIRNLPPAAAVTLPNAATPIFSVDWTASTSIPSQITAARSSAATYYNASGVRSSAASGAARADYDPTAFGILKGVLAEEQRVNIALHSNDLYTTSAGYQGATQSVATTGVDNSSLMTQWQSNATNSVGGALFSPLYTITSGSTYSLSLDFLYQTETYVFLTLEDTASHWISVVFNCVTGAFVQTAASATGGTVVSYSIKPLAKGIFRATITGSLTATSARILAGMAKASGNTFDGVDGYVNNVPTVSGTNKIFVDSAMIELGSFPTSHIVTTTAAVTRSADLISSTDATLLAAKGWIAETGEAPAATAKTLVGVNTVIGIGSTTGDALTTTDGGTQTTTATGGWAGLNRGGLAWDSTPRTSISFDGSAATTAANTSATPTALYFGNTNNGASGFLNGHLRMMACYSTLDDTQLSYLTAPGTNFTIPGAASVNAVVAQTLGALVTAATDAVLAQATIAQTLGALGQAAPATVLDQAVVAQTLGALAQASTASAPASATTTQALGALGQTAAATAPIAITVAQNLGALTQDPALTHPDTAAAAQTLGAIVQAAAGGVIDNATAVQTLGALAQAATASAPAALTAAQTLGALGQAATATAVDQAVVSQTLGALSQAAAATHPDSAAVTQNLGALTQATTAGVVDTAAAAQTLGAIVQTATAGAIDAATAAQTLGALAQAATATAPLAVAASQTLGALAQAATGTVSDAGVVAQALGALVQSASGSVVTSATVAQTLGALTQNATATLSVVRNAAFDQSLGVLGQAATGGVVDTAVASQALGSLGQVASAGALGAAAVNQALGVLGQAASGAVVDAAAASQALGALQQAASAATASGFNAVQALGTLGQALDSPRCWTPPRSPKT